VSSPSRQKIAALPMALPTEDKTSTHHDRLTAHTDHN